MQRRGHKIYCHFPFGSILSEISAQKKETKQRAGVVSIAVHRRGNRSRRKTRTLLAARVATSASATEDAASRVARHRQDTETHTSTSHANGRRNAAATQRRRNSSVRIPNKDVHISSRYTVCSQISACCTAEPSRPDSARPLTLRPATFFFLLEGKKLLFPDNHASFSPASLPSFSFLLAACEEQRLA